MIIFGLSSCNLKQGDHALYDCDHCGTEQSVQLYFYVRYFHIFWIPVIPLYRTGASQCNHCRQVLDKAKMQPQLLSGYDLSNKKIKTPLKYFSWLIIVVAFVAFAAITALFDTKDTKAWLQQPKTGDVYEINEDGAYTLYRVNAIKEDSIYVTPHTYTANSLSELRKLNNNYPDEYSDITIGLSKHELTALYDSKNAKKNL